MPIKDGLFHDLNDVEQSITSSLLYLLLAVAERLNHWVDKQGQVLVATFLVECDGDHRDAVESGTFAHDIILLGAHVEGLDLCQYRLLLIRSHQCLDFGLDLQGCRFPLLDGPTRFIKAK